MEKLDQENEGRCAHLTSSIMILIKFGRDDIPGLGRWMETRVMKVMDGIWIRPKKMSRRFEI